METNLTQDIWEPMPKQAEFIRLPDDIYEGFFGGAAGPGKSEVLVMLPLIREFYKVRGFKGLIMRRTRPELQAEIILRAHKFYPKTGAIWNGTDNTYRWPQYDSYVRFGYAQYKDDIRKYDSAEYQYFAPDELTSFLEFQYKFIAFSRVRSTIGITPIVRSASNPGNTGHGWVRKRFVEPAKKGRVRIRDTKTNIERIFIPAKLSDNTLLEKNDPTYRKKLESLPDAERVAKLEGDWYTFVGQTFEFRSERFPDEPENAVHVIPPPNIPDYWPRILATDIGFSVNNYNLWGAVSPDNRLYTYREYGTVKAKASVWASEVGFLSAGEDIRDWVMDHTAFAEAGQDHTLAIQANEYANIGINPRKADKGNNSRRSGMKLIQEMLRWTSPPRANKSEFSNELSRKILKAKGIEAYAKYMQMFEDTQTTQKYPRVLISEDCPELISTIPLCVYAKDKDDNEIDDVAEFDGDDPYDTFRYLCRAMVRFVAESYKRNEELKDFESVRERLEVTGDMTEFYRTMERKNPTRRRNRGRGIRRYVDFSPSPNSRGFTEGFNANS